MQGFKIIVLKGPSGVGKMATLQCIGRELGYEIHEWIDPTTTYTTFADENTRTWLHV
jgi:guanylate kinase